MSSTKDFLIKTNSEGLLFPSIIRIVKENGSEHFVVFLDYNYLTKKVVLYDPSCGKIKVSPDTFSKWALLDYPDQDRKSIAFMLFDSSIINSKENSFFYDHSFLFKKLRIYL